MSLCPEMRGEQCPAQRRSKRGRGAVSSPTGRSGGGLSLHHCTCAECSSYCAEDGDCEFDDGVPLGFSFWFHSLYVFRFVSL